MDHIEARDCDAGPENRPRSASLLATCTHCEKLHRAGQLEFNPVCSVCAADRATMRHLGMTGSYPLGDQAIAAELTRTSPGNYALGYLEDERFVVFYVGRSDTDVKERLRDWVGVPSQYERYGPAARAAWSTRPRRSTPLGTPALGRVGCAGTTSYTHFAFSYASSPETALDKELQNYEDFGGRGELDNAQPPARHPRGAGEAPGRRR
ncbi:MAG: hypothetical protein ACYTGV_16485 [Planctomycetota bacterium]|jgi:hypothetical protein